MIQLSRWKVILVVASAIIGCLLAYPNLLSPAQRAALPGWLPKNALNLGLDLQGGSYLLLEVDLAAMREKRLTNMAEDVRVSMREARININGIQRDQGGVVVTIAQPSQYDAAFEVVRGDFGTPEDFAEKALGIGADLRERLKRDLLVG